MIKAILDAAEFIIGSRQSFNGYPEPDAVAESARQLDNTLGEVTIGAYYEPPRLIERLVNDLTEVFSYKGLAAGDVDEGEPAWYLPNKARGEFISLFCRELPGVAHVTPGIAAVGNDQTGFHMYLNPYSKIIINDLLMYQ